MPHEDTHSLQPLHSATVGSTVASATISAAIEPNCDRAAVEAIGFRIIDELGRGGMGVVYRAFDPVIEREIALKILHHKYAPDSSVASRFLEEGKITGQLQHPGIPAVHQIGSLSDGRPYLAMKLIKGKTLGDLLAHETSTERNANNWLAVFEAICQAVAYAHARNVIHRDLKAQNVMVGSFGEVQVMDWGLAKVVGSEKSQVRDQTDSAVNHHTEIRSSRDSEGSLTEVGSVLGTLAYMPPEQAGGENHRIDQRSDVFSLGALLCVILTGKPPYPDKSVESVRLAAIRADLAEAYGRLDTCGAEPGWIALARACLSFRPEDRPKDAGCVADEVATLRADSEQRARAAELRRAKAEVQAEEQRKRRKFQLALAGSLLILCLAVGAAGWWIDRQAGEKAQKEADYAAQRKAESDRNHEAIERALAQTEIALRRDNPNLIEIDANLNQVEQRLPLEGEEKARHQFQTLKNDRKMLGKLYEIDAKRWSRLAGADAFDAQYARSEYPIAFRSYGIDLDRETPPVLADTIRRASISQELITALNAWWAMANDSKLSDLINYLDDQPEHIALRSAFAAKDEAGIRQHVERVDGNFVPPTFAQFIGLHGLTPQKEALRILTRAQANHPNHFGLAVATALRVPRNNFNDEVSYYRVALAIRPNNVICLNNLAGALADKKELEEAIATYEKVLQIDPNYAFAHHNLAMALREKDAKRAMLEFRAALRLDPQNYQMHNNLGSFLADNREYPAAILEFEEAVRLNPTYVNAFRNLGNIRVALKDFDGAIRAHQDAVRMEPEHAYGRELLGRAFLAKGDAAHAIAEFEKAIDIKPENSPAYRYLGDCFYMKGDLNKAVDAFHQAIKFNPADPYAHLHLALTLQVMKDIPGAAREMGKAVELSPKEANLHHDLGILLEQMKDLEGAIRAHQQAISLKADDARYYHSLANALRANGDGRGAIAAYQAAIRIDGNHAVARNNLALMLEQQKDRKGAIEQLKTAVRIDPQYALAFENLGSILWEQHDEEDAIAAFKEAVKLKIHSTTSHLALAQYLAKRGEPYAALEVLNQATKIEPKWLTSLDTHFRYYLACYSVLAGTGQGKDHPPEGQWVSLRRQARVWLDTELRAYRKIAALAELNADNNLKRSINEMMASWRQDPNLSAVRDPDGLKKLPVDERQGWEQFWSDVGKVYDPTTTGIEVGPPPRVVK